MDLLLPFGAKKNAIENYKGGNFMAGSRIFIHRKRCRDRKLEEGHAARLGLYFHSNGELHRVGSTADSQYSGK